YVPIALGVAHQAVAMLLWFAWLTFYHDLKNYVSYNHKITLNNNRYEFFRKSKYRTNRSRRLPNSTDLP
ncbi:MAG TPA: hypothetical protein VFG39_05855, partial [Balneolaceae bacterium]|nr:hypothetical protein [Balneolaceae bacterium]